MRLSNIRRFLGYRRDEPAVVAMAVNSYGVSDDPQWPSLPFSTAYPGHGVVLTWYGRNSAPVLDGRACDHLLALYGGKARLREVVPVWQDWVSCSLPFVGNHGWPCAAAAAAPALEVEALRAAYKTIVALTTGYRIDGQQDLENAVKDYARWWNVRRQQQRALAAALNALAVAQQWFGRYSPKGTDQIAACARKLDGALHGGDGNSGECAHVAETISIGQAGQNGKDDAWRRATATADESRAAGHTACAAPDNAESEPTTRQGAGEDDRGANNPAVARRTAGPDRSADAEPAQGAAATEPVGGDQPRCDGAVVAKTANKTDDGKNDALGGQRDDDDTVADNSDAEQSALDSAQKWNCDKVSKRAPGGWFASKEVAVRRALSLGRDAQEVARALRRLVRAETVGLGDEPSPRISGKRLVCELAGRSVRLGRAHRAELEPGRIIIAPDLSSSCSACAPETYAAAIAIGREMPESVEVVPHSNGFRNDGAHWNWTAVRLLVVFGDWDGAEVYRAAIAAGVKLIWLDSYDKAGGVRPSADAAKGRFAGWRQSPVKFDGVGAARDAAIALRAVAGDARRRNDQLRRRQ